MSDLTKRDYELAILSQSAPNIRAITASLLEVMDKIPFEERRDHPIVYLYVTQLAHLIKWDKDGMSQYNKAHSFCTSKLHEEDKEW